MKILIITTTYNRKLLLERCVESVNSLNIIKDCSITHLIINDNPSAKIDCIDFQKHPLIERIVKNNDTNLGKNKSIDRHLPNFRNHDYFITLDDDDIITSDSISEIVANASAYPDSILVYSKINKSTGKTFNTTPVPRSCETAIEIANACNMSELSFVCPVLWYIVAKSSSHLKLGQNTPELYIYQQVSKVAPGKVKGFNFSVMICEYQTEGLTSLFYKRLLSSPESFTDYYRMMMHESGEKKIHYIMIYMFTTFLKNINRLLK